MRVQRTVRMELELAKEVQEAQNQWLSARPKYTENDWWREAARLMAMLPDSKRVSRESSRLSSARGQDKPVPGEIIEREDGTSLEYTDEVEVPELEPVARATEDHPAIYKTEAGKLVAGLPTHVAGKVMIGGIERTIPTKETRQVVRPVTNPGRAQ